MKRGANQKQVANSLVDAVSSTIRQTKKEFATTNGKVSTGQKNTRFLIKGVNTRSYRSAREDGMSPRVDAPELSLFIISSEDEAKNT